MLNHREQKDLFNQNDFIKKKMKESKLLFILSTSNRNSTYPYTFRIFQYTIFLASEICM